MAKRNIDSTIQEVPKLCTIGNRLKEGSRLVEAKRLRPNTSSIFMPDSIYGSNGCTIVQNTIGCDGLVGSLSRGSFRSRMLRDIIPLRPSTDRNAKAQLPGKSRPGLSNSASWESNLKKYRDIFDKIAKEKNHGRFFVYSEHLIPNFEHIHVVHDCSYGNGSCRCTFLGGIPFLQRQKRYRCFSTELDANFWFNAAKYFLLAEDGRRAYVKMADGEVISTGCDFATTRLLPLHSKGSEPAMDDTYCQIYAQSRTANAQNELSSTTIHEIGGQDGNEQSPMPRDNKEAAVFRFLIKNLVSPPEICDKLPQYFEDNFLININSTNDRFKNAIDLYKRFILPKSLLDIYTMYKDCPCIFAASNGDVNQHYWNLPDSVQFLTEFLHLQLIDTEAITSFVENLCRVLTKNNGKKNCIWLKGPSDCGKSWLIKSVEGLMITSGRISLLNKNNNFPFSSVIDCRLIVLDELNFDPILWTDPLKLLLSGDPISVSVKYKNDVMLYKTPVITMSNTDCLPSTDHFTCRYDKFHFNVIKHHKMFEKLLHPFSFLYVFKKYGVWDFELKDLL